MKKATFYTELAYLFGIAGLALGTALNFLLIPYSVLSL